MQRGKEKVLKEKMKWLYYVKFKVQTSSCGVAVITLAFLTRDRSWVRFPPAVHFMWVNARSQVCFIYYPSTQAALRLCRFQEGGYKQMVAVAIEWSEKAYPGCRNPTSDQLMPVAFTSTVNRSTNWANPGCWALKLLYRCSHFTRLHSLLGFGLQLYHLRIGATIRDPVDYKRWYICVLIVWYNPSSM